MAKPKHDYDNPDFFKRIEALAMNGYTDEEIANELNLTREVFTTMKNGNYSGWSKADNKRRGEQISNVLAHGRTRINAIVRSAYLKSAIGGKKIKGSVVKYVQEKCECMGSDKQCPNCGGTGWVTLTDRAVVQETEQELPPNMQAISTWLFHHDPEWRKIEQKQDEDDIPTDIKHGVDVDKWIEKEINND